VLLLAAALLLAGGCRGVFNARSARDVTREELLELGDTGTADFLHYVGTSDGYHYVFDTRHDKEASYRIRADQMKLAETFAPGDQKPYVLYTWLIEGKRLGRKPD
jgi:hypothetical protein